MPSWIRTSLWLVIAGLVLLWLAPAYHCVRGHLAEVDHQEQVVRTMSPVDVHAKLDKIAARNGLSGEINVLQHAKDVMRLEYYREHVKEFAETGLGAKQRCTALSRYLYENAVTQGMDDEIRVELTRLRKGHEPEPVAWGAVGWSLFNFALWLVCFWPVALIMLFCKVESMFGCPITALTAMKRKPGELLAAVIFWPIGLAEFRPETPLGKQVQEVANALDRLRIRKPEHSIRWETVESAFLFRAFMPSFGRLLSTRSTMLPYWAVSCFRHACTVPQYIWGMPNWGWYRLIVAVFRYPRLCSRAVYVTLAAMICMIIGSVPIAVAAEASGKEEEPLVGAVIWTHVKPVGDSPPNQSLLFLMQDGWELGLYGYNGNGGILEAAKLFKVTEGRLALGTGVFVDYHLGTEM